MNAQETRVRNHNIMRLRGILPRVAYLIPKKIQEENKDDFEEFERLSKLFMGKLDEAKKKNFTCAECNSKHGKETKAKRAKSCDFCRRWDVPLFLVSK